MPTCPYNTKRKKKNSIMAEKDNSENQVSVVETLRITARENYCSFRERRRQTILKGRRTGFSDVEKPLLNISEEEMKTLAQKLKTSKDRTTLNQIQMGACLGTKNIEAFFQVNGALPTLVGLLCCNDAIKQLDAAACLTNLATGTHKHTYKIAKAAGAYLVSFIKGHSPSLQDQCAWAAGNIVTNCQACFDLLEAQGLIPALIPLLESPYAEVFQSGIFSLQACTRNNCKNSESWITENLFHSLIRLSCKLPQHVVVVDALYTLSNIICDKVESMSEVLHTQVTSCILSHLDTATNSDNFDILVATPCVGCLISLSTKSDELGQFISDIEVFSKCVSRIMACQYHHLRSEFLFLLSNILVSSGSRSPEIDFQCVVENIKPFLSLISSYNLQALYFLAVLSRTQNVPAIFFAKNGVLQLVDVLCVCDKSDVQTAAKSFKSTLNFS